MGELVSWYWFAVRWTVRDTWKGLPGPVWVKLIICLAGIAALLMPGQADDIMLVLIIGWVKRRKAKHV
jgi:hypothetical protein